MSRIPIDDDPQLDRQSEEPSDQHEPSDELRQLQQERDDLYQRLARATADFQNSRRRLEADMEQRSQYANTQLIKALLPVIDNFERALAVDPATSDAGSIQKGLTLVHDQMLSVLKQNNVDVIAPEPGTKFDPNLHQALMQQPSEEYEEPTVTQLLQKGYALHGRTIRPAQVAVSKTS
jgi:molecular chaperone GrpE